ncbi:MAG: DUF3795 domain-containing protein, partial [Candidatus Thorarchaeota archaeon]
MDIDKWDIGICGLNCGKCPDYHSDNCEIECGRDPPEVPTSSDCVLMLCAREKDHRYCFECSEFICQKLDNFSSDGYAHHKQTVENMKRMREIGIQAWI